MVEVFINHYVYKQLNTLHWFMKIIWSFSLSENKT